MKWWLTSTEAIIECHAQHIPRYIILIIWYLSKLVRIGDVVARIAGHVAGGHYL